MPVDHELAIRKLKKFARSKGIDVRTVKGTKRSIPYLAYFDPQKRRIRVCESVKKDRLDFIYVLAHEIGHSIDFDSMSKKERQMHDRVCSVLNIATALDCIPPKYIKDLIISREKAANRNGEALLKELDIRLQKRTILRCRKDSIDGYRALFRRNGHS